MNITIEKKKINYDVNINSFFPIPWKRRLRNGEKIIKKSQDYPRNVEQKNKIWKREWQ